MGGRASPPLALGAVHLAVLWSFAVAQPILENLGRNAEFFVARGNTSADIVLLACGLTLGPPLVLALGERLAALASPRVAYVLHLVLVAALAAALALGVVKGTMSGSALALAVAGAFGVAVAVGYWRVAAARSFLTVLAPAPAVFVCAFLLFSPAKELVLPGEAAAHASRVESDTPVVLAVFDELPTISLMDARRRIDAASFPNFGRLARTSTWYRNATTVGDGTNLAVPSIFSGRLPSSKLPTARRYPQSVFTLLGDAYDLHVLEPITRVCPQRLCGRQARRDPPARRARALISDVAIVGAHLLLPRGLAAGLPPIDRDFEDFGGQEAGVRAPTRRPVPGRSRPGAMGIAGSDLFARRLRDGERFVRRVRRPGARPPLYVAHFIVPHVPWRLLPSGHQYPVKGPTLPGSIERVWTRDAFLVAQATQRHLLQVGYADRLLGRLINRLERAGVWERALVVVVADHGIGLRPGRTRREVVRGNFAAVAGVPLFVKAPDQRTGRIDDAPASTIDILPTVLRTVRSSAHPRVDGAPLGGAAIAGRRPRVRSGRRGDYTAMGAAEFVRARDAELARQRRGFPRGLRRVFSAVGPNRHLLGRRVTTLPVVTGRAEVQINDADAFARVQPGSGVLPVYVSGYFVTAKEGGMPLAIAVNGRIRAVAVSYPVRDMTRFSALIPPTSLRAGANRVEVFAVDGGRLVLLGRAGS
jgi:hypothetical protein